MVGDRLKYYRTLRMMSQEDLAEVMGFPPNTISKIEHGARKVTIEEAVRFAEILAISLQELAGIPAVSAQHQEVKTMVHQCKQKVREAETALHAVSDLTENLERSLFSL